MNETIDAVVQTDWNTVGRFGIRYILNWHLSNRLRLGDLQSGPLEIVEYQVRFGA
ncbi:MAG: hypothetical protein WBM74_12295 [Polyangiales bacterium]